MIAEGLKGNCSVTEVHLVSFGVLFVCLVLLTCAGQMDRGPHSSMSEAVRQEITQVLQELHGADKGVAITSDSCCFYDFETCEEINVSSSRFSRSSKVRLLA